MPVNGELRHRIERALARFSPSWESRDAARRAVALKMLILCELAGGRLRVVDALGLIDNTLDNYRHGKTEPRHSTLTMMAELAEVPIEYLGNDWSVEDGIIHFAPPEIPPAGFSEPSRLWDLADRVVIRAYEDETTGQLSLEPRVELHSGYLQRYRSPQTGILRLVDLAHAAGAQQRFDSVWP